MSLARHQFTVVDDAGNVLPGASVEVRREAVGSPIVSLFADREGATPIGNPFAADADGFAAFHVAGGAYRITVTSGGFTRTWHYVGIGTAGEVDVDLIVFKDVDDDLTGIRNFGLSGHIDLVELAGEPDAPAVNIARFYARDADGATRLFFRHFGAGANAILFQDENADVPVGIRNLPLTGHLDLAEIASPSTPDVNMARIYARDDGGITRLFYKNSAGGQIPLGHGISPMDYGAVGDGVANDTTAVQAAFDDAVDNNVPVFGLGKTYLIDNLSIKNRDNGTSFEPVLRAYGQGATLKKRNSADNTYLVATSRWISSSVFGNYPFLLEDWILDGNSIAERVIVDTAFACKVRKNHIKGGTAYGVVQPTVGKDGSTNITASRCCGLYEENLIYQNGSSAVGFANLDTASTSFISDYKLIRNEIFGNGKNLDLQQAAGWLITDNQVFGHTNTGVTEGAFVEEGFASLQGNTWGHGLNNASYCLTVAAETFPMRIFGDNFQTENAAELGLNVTFGTGARIAQVIGCRFEGTACGINHAGNSANNELISKDNIFDIASPYTFSGGSGHAGLMRVEGDRASNADPAVISPAQITANQDNYNPTGLQYANALRLITDASRNITGLQKGYPGRVLSIFNVSPSQNFVLVSNSGSSTAGNRFFLRANRTIAPGDSITLWYDATSAGWREQASSLG